MKYQPLLRNNFMKKKLNYILLIFPVLIILKLFQFYQKILFIILLNSFHVIKKNSISYYFVENLF